MSAPTPSAVVIFDVDALDGFMLPDNCQVAGWVATGDISLDGNSSRLRTIKREQFDLLHRCGLLWKVKNYGVSVLECVATLASGHVPAVGIGRYAMRELAIFFKQLQWSVTLVYQEEGKQHIRQF